MTLTALLVMTGVILPVAVKLAYESKNVRYESAANHLLYEELTSALAGGSGLANRSVVKEGHVLEVIYPSERTVCVKYLDSFKEWTEICGELE